MVIIVVDSGIGDETSPREMAVSGVGRCDNCLRYVTSYAVLGNPCQRSAIVQAT